MFAHWFWSRGAHPAQWPHRFPRRLNAQPIDLSRTASITQSFRIWWNPCSRTAGNASSPFPNPHSKLEYHTKIQLVSGPLEGSTGVPPVCDALLLGSHGYGFFKDTSVRTAETAMHPSLLCQCHFHKDIRISRQFRNPAASAQCENPSPAFPPTRSWRPATPRAERLPEGRGRVGE